MSLNLNYPSAPPSIVDETLMPLALLDQLNNLPDPKSEIMPGIKWGCSSQVFTPAYWKAQYIMFSEKNDVKITYRLGASVIEEVVACLLGGYGLKAEVGLAAFNRLKERGEIREGVNYECIHNSLSEPFELGNNSVRYRFPNQKAEYIHLFLNSSSLHSIPLSNDILFRNWLLSFKGIGPKTASWITRNFLDSESVAILDIHILRAGIIMGIFSENFDIQKNYFKLEQDFIDFCDKLHVRPSVLDTIIWLQMKSANKTALKLLKKD